MKRRHQANVIRPTYPVWIVDYGNKVEKNLTEDRLRPIVGTNGSDDCIHVDAKTGEVHQGLHSTNASNRGLPFGLVRIGKIHDVLRCCFYLARKLSFDKNFIPLRKKADGSTELASSLRLVTFSVEKLPWNIWDTMIFDMTRIKI